MIDNDLNSLEKIRARVRRLCRMPSEAQLTNNDLDNFINEFVLYEFPVSIMSDSLSTTLSFYTSKNNEKYQSLEDVSDENKPLYNFKNKYLYIYDDIYINGSKATVYKSRSEFDAMFVNTYSEYTIGTGDGVTTSFSGTLDEYPINKNTVTISSLDINGSSIYLKDNDGTLEYDGVSYGTIDYDTGSYSFTFATAPASGESVIFNGEVYVAGVPTDVLYYPDYFRLRPIPDGVYKVDVKVMQRPTALLSSGDITELAQWGVYISYGAAMKILSEYGDAELMNNLVPEFQRQEILINRKKILNNRDKRTATIFAGKLDNYDII